MGEIVRSTNTFGEPPARSVLRMTATLPFAGGAPQYLVLRDAEKARGLRRFQQFHLPLAFQHARDSRRRKAQMPRQIGLAEPRAIELGKKPGSVHLATPGSNDMQLSH